MESTAAQPVTDLPVAQANAGALAYPQGVPMGMPPVEDLEGGDGFSIMGLVHSLRRQLLPAFGFGLVVASLIALGLWYSIPVSYTAESVLRVNRELSKGNASDYMIYKETQASLIKSNFVLRTALRDIEINQLPMVLTDAYGRRRERPEAWLASALAVSPDETELLWVRMRGRHKEHTELILNNVLKAYQHEIVNKERMEKSTTLAKLRTRYTQLFDSIKKKSDEISALAEQLGVTDNSAVAHQQAMKVNELNQAQRELDRIRMSLNEAQDQYRLLQVEAQLGTSNPTEFQILDMLEQDARFFELTATIDQYKDEVEQLQGLVQPGSTQLLGLQQEIVRLERKRERMSAEIRPRIIARLKQENGVSPQALQRQLALQRQQVINYRGQAERATAIVDQRLEEVKKYGGTSGDLEARMDDLAAQRRDMQIVRADMQALEIELDGPERVSIIQPATISQDSNWKSKIIQIAGGWVMSLVGCIIAIAYWDYLGKRVNGEEDVTRAVRVVGTLPSNQRGIFGGKRPIDEAMKVAIDSIRTAILYNRNHPTQCVMITSATGHEGRSTVASQLAVSMARSGKTTLLVDADFRNPQQHSIFGVHPSGGLGEMLRGEQTSDQAIVATAIENVWLLGAGRCDQRALQGLTADQAKAIFQDFRDRFDVIIIDASPVLTSPDALLIGQHADCAMLSVRRDISQTPKVNAAVDRLQSVGVPLLGAVVNGSSVEVRSGNTPIAAPESEEEKPALANA